MTHQPWIEKYRPNNMSDIVLDDINKRILTNIIDNNTMPNLLLYGPPGTGKTTTIINLIKKYETTNNQSNKGLVIHLNASDDRGVDIIRNQIYQFVKTKGLFCNGTKFVILDEADYMTKNAQTALKLLIQLFSKDIKYCLICNYISRIDKPLQNEFIKLRFSSLPKKEILNYLTKIKKKEELKIDNKSIEMVQKLFNSDIRSMVNFLQSNYLNNNIKIINNNIWENVLNSLIYSDKETCLDLINKTSLNYNLQIKKFIENFICYLVYNKPEFTKKKFINFYSDIIHQNDCNSSYLLNYLVLSFKELCNKL